MEFAETSEAPAPLIPAATILLLRDTPSGIEVLLLRRNKALKSFGGAWVFPGGRVDEADGPGLSDIERAKQTAIRETREETGLDISSHRFATLSNWIPPDVDIRRFSTWFFVAKAPDRPVKIDEGEIHDYQWISPSKAIETVPSPDLVIMPPTYVSLHSLMNFASADEAVRQISQEEPRVFNTKFIRGEQGFTTLWPGDAAYDDLDLTKPGPRRRLNAGFKSWQYENSFS